MEAEVLKATSPLFLFNTFQLVPGPLQAQDAKKQERMCSSATPQALFPRVV